MEVKINREIRDYQESIFFGLNLRQLVFSILAIGVAVGIYFGLNNILGTALSIIHNYFNMHRPVDGIKYNR